jgi:hypothetical protein
MARIWLRLTLLLTLVSLIVGPAFAQGSLRRQIQQRQMQQQHQQAQKQKEVAPAPASAAAPTPALEVQVAPPVPAGPPKPVDMPAVPPQVTFVQGQLLIVAQNSTLGDILDAVHKSTGATIDIASGDTSERVVGRIGPGIARDVLTDLLNGTKFNYVMVSPSGDATALDKVLLTPKTITLASNSSSGPVGGSVPLPTSSSGPVFTPAPPGTTANRTLLQQLQPQVMPVQPQQPPTADEDTSNDSNSDDQDQAAPGSAPPGQATETAPPAPQNPATMQEQMIQELQRRYQDRVNMQQKQGQPPPQQPPPPPQ